jgi:isocitrate dehydrogenase
VSKIIYTLTDEAPALATYSLLPIVQAFTKAAGCVVETRDISLAGRILAQFPERLGKSRAVADDLKELGEIAKTPEANIIKLPNISASVPQLHGAIKELKQQGYDVPDYPEEPRNDAEKDIQLRYARVLGSAVNPVLREGNSDRRVAASVKQYAKKHPHSMGRWSKDSKTHVASMSGGDFYSSEQSAVVQKTAKLKVELASNRGEKTVLKDGIGVKEGDVIAASTMNRRALRDYFAKQIADAKAKGLLLSLHLKATMMKVSDPIMFGHAVEVYYQDVFTKHADELEKLSVEPNNGIGDLYAKIKALPEAARPVRPISPPQPKRGQSSRWWTRARASRTCMCRATSSSTRRCRPPFARRARCGGRTASCTT